MQSIHTKYLNLNYFLLLLYILLKVFNLYNRVDAKIDFKIYFLVVGISNVFIYIRFQYLVEISYLKLIIIYHFEAIFQ